MAGEDNGSWHLDKHVPLALIFAMVGQLAVLAFGAAVMFKDIETNRDGLKSLDGRLIPLERSVGTQAVQLGRIEESIRGMREDVNRLLAILERRLE